MPTISGWHNKFNVCQACLEYSNKLHGMDYVRLEDEWEKNGNRCEHVSENGWKMVSYWEQIKDSGKKGKVT